MSEKEAIKCNWLDGCCGVWIFFFFFFFLLNSLYNIAGDSQNLNLHNVPMILEFSMYTGCLMVRFHRSLQGTGHLVAEQIPRLAVDSLPSRQPHRRGSDAASLPLMKAE
jgi:hypothetical protein